VSARRTPAAGPAEPYRDPGHAAGGHARPGRVTSGPASGPGSVQLRAGSGLSGL